jgi:hypothetical protein
MVGRSHYGWESLCKVLSVGRQVCVAHSEGRARISL